MLAAKRCGRGASVSRQKDPASGVRLGCGIISRYQRGPPRDPPLRADVREEGRRRLGVMNAEAIAGRSARPIIAALVLLVEAIAGR